MKLSTKIILPIILISALLILLTGCGVVPDESPGFTPGTITGIIAAPCCTTSAESADGETTSPEYWCYYCQETWSLQDGIEVVLTYGEDEVATTTTNEDGEYVFTDVPPGKNYVITAYCPDYNDNRPLVKDVALEVASTFDAKITDLDSTSLGLVVDFLVYYTEWGPEDISLDAVIADKPIFPNFPKFKALIYEVRRVLENCELNLLTDDDVQYATCRAAEEISGLDIGCGPGYGGEGEGECENPITEAGGPYTDEVCPGVDSIIIFDGSGSGTGALVYDWIYGDGTAALDAGPSPSHKYLNPFTSPYTVTLTVTDDCGSTTDTATVTITESAGVTADAGSDQSEEVCPGAQASIDFTGSGTGTGALSYSWDFDGNGTSTAQNPSGILFGVGTYYVTLTVTDQCDSTSDEIIVTVTECINDAPVIDNLPPTTTQKVNIWQTYTYDVDATDPNGDTLTYSLTTKPNGMEINPSTGVITWTYANCVGETKMGSAPTKGDRCNCDIPVTVKVTDDGCCGHLFDEESFIVEVMGP